MILQVLADKSVSQDTSFLCNQYDNESASIVINLPALFINANYSYFILCKPPKDAGINQYSIPLILNIDKLTFIVNSTLSQYIGNWQFAVVIKDTLGNLVALTDYFVGKVKSGIAEQDQLNEQIEDSNLKLLYAADLEAEALRVIAEDERKLNETSRVASEETREGSEATREINETNREDNESDRIAAENIRVSNEDTRLLNETTRQETEAARVTAEINRGIIFDQLVEDGVLQTNIEGRLTELETTYAPRLTTAEEQINTLDANIVFRNVKEFGAKGDGVTDDTIAIQSALNTCNNLEFDIGDFLITSPLIVSSYKNLVGVYGKTRLITTSDISIVTNDDTKFLYMVTLKNIVFRKPSGNNYHIKLGNGNTVKIQKCIFYSDTLIENEIYTNKCGVYLYKANGITNVWVNFIEECFFNQSSINIETSDSYITKCMFWSQNREYGIRLGNNQISVQGCQIVGTPYKGGIFIDNTSYHRIVDNFFDGASGSITVNSGYGISGVTKYTMISNNLFWDMCYSAIMLRNPNNIKIIGNIFSENNRGFIVDGVTKYGVADIHLIVDFTESSSITQNSIENNNFAYTKTHGNSYYSIKEEEISGKFANKITGNLFEYNVTYVNSHGISLGVQSQSLVANGNLHRGKEIIRKKELTKYKISITNTLDFTANMSSVMFWVPYDGQNKINIDRIALRFNGNTPANTDFKILIRNGLTVLKTINYTGAIYLKTENINDVSISSGDLNIRVDITADFETMKGSLIVDYYLGDYVIL